MTGSDGSDTLDYSAADAGVTVNLGGPAAQNTGGAGTDTLAAAENAIGSGFADVLAGPVGDNVLDGGPGIDTADYSSATLGVSVDLFLAGPQDTVTASIDTLTAVENATGGSGRNTLAGTVGANSLSGGAGNDTPVTSAGSDVLDCGTGSDTVDYSARPPGVVVNLTAGTGSNAGDTDLLTGDGAANSLSGGAGNDRLRGLGGADVLTGGSGVDTADCSTFFPANGRIGVVVSLVGGEAIGDGVDSLAQVESVRGSSFDDRLLGNGLANTLLGGGGNDYIAGGAGQDVLRGGDGSDTFQARDGARDRVYGADGRDRPRVDRGRDVARSIAAFLR